jgi:predicted GNAT family N-acyltransferase
MPPEQLKALALDAGYAVLEYGGHVLVFEQECPTSETK